jgi:hypothetical protein
VKLKLLDLFTAQQIRAAAEVLGKLRDVAKVTNGGDLVQCYLTEQVIEPRRVRSAWESSS